MRAHLCCLFSRQHREERTRCAMPDYGGTMNTITTPVSAVMTARPVCVRAETPVKDIAEVLTRDGISAVAVVGRDGALVGVVSKKDLLPMAEGDHFRWCRREAARHAQHDRASARQRSRPRNPASWGDVAAPLTQLRLRADRPAFAARSAGSRGDAGEASMTAMLSMCRLISTRGRCSSSGDRAQCKPSELTNVSGSGVFCTFAKGVFDCSAPSCHWWMSGKSDCLVFLRGGGRESSAPACSRKAFDATPRISS